MSPNQLQRGCELRTLGAFFGVSCVEIQFLCVGGGGGARENSQKSI